MESPTVDESIAKAGEQKQAGVTDQGNRSEVTDAGFLRMSEILAAIAEQGVSVAIETTGNGSPENSYYTKRATYTREMMQEGEGFAVRISINGDYNASAQNSEGSGSSEFSVAGIYRRENGKHLILNVARNGSNRVIQAGETAEGVEYDAFKTAFANGDVDSFLVRKETVVLDNNDDLIDYQESEDGRYIFIPEAEQQVRSPGLRGKIDVTLMPLQKAVRASVQSQNYTPQAFSL